MADIDVQELLEEIEQTHTGDTNYVTAKTFPASNFVANKKYLMFFSARVSSDSDTAEMSYKLVEAPSTDVPETEMVGEKLIHYSWWGVYTVPATPVDILFQHKTAAGASTVRSDAMALLKIRLSDDLTENTDWRLAEDFTKDATPETAYVTYANIASFTPANPTDDRLIFAMLRMTGGATNRSSLWHLEENVNGGGFVEIGGEHQVEGETSTETRQWIIAWKDTSGTSGTREYRIQMKNDHGATNHRHAYSSIFVLEQDAVFADHDEAKATTPLAGDDALQVLNTIANYAPAATGDQVILRYVLTKVNTGNSWKNSLELDDVDEDADFGSGDVVRGFDPADFMGVFRARLKSVASTGEKLEHTGDGLVVAGTWDERILAVFSVALAAGGVAIVKVEGETVEIAEGDLHILGQTKVEGETAEIAEGDLTVLDLVRLANETIQIVEGDITVLALVRQEDETVQISEGDIPIVGLIRVEGDTVDITESDLHFLGKVKVDNETVQITEVDLKVIGQTKVESETVQISEDDITVRALLRIEGESEQITEGTIRVMALVRLQNETVQIPEGNIKIVGLIRQEAETLQIVEGDLHLLGKVKVDNETLQIAEGDLHLLGKVKVEGDAVQISEGDIHTLGLVRIENETEQLSELDITVRDLVRIENEVANIVEAVISTLDLIKVESETVQITDVDLHLLGLVRVELDTVEISEGDIRIVVSGSALGTTRLTFRAKVETPVFKSKIEHKFKG